MNGNIPVKPIKKVLIANRGEIAVRVIRACREMGVRTVAVYSEADRGAVHVNLADEAQLIGPPPARESYLNIDRIIEAAKKSGADAIHPGYGFLSEKAEFVDACEAAGIIFIGPPGSAMRAMGEKTTARINMQNAGVPTVPGDNGEGGRGFPSVELAMAAAEKVGYPVLLKAANGGGGRGQRIVESPDKLAAAFESARRESKAAFNDDTIYIERFVTRPRHVEIQIFGDRHGNYVYLFERDCSVQRRNQKVIEESPSPALNDDIRHRMGEVAVRAAAAVGYVGAGTCEFLLAQDKSFYFLEMNTRLQVEHPVTEMVTGIDLVQLQLRVAEGHPLPFRQEDLRLRGAAIQCRVYAEDPLRFLPSPGRITRMRTPGGPFVRNDSGVVEGSEISTFYDPMISKLIVWGETRQEAIRRMARALSEYQVLGIKTNLPFHRRVMLEPDFSSGNYDTGYIESHKSTLLAPYTVSDDEIEQAAIVAAISAATAAPRTAPGTGAASATEPSAWRAGWAGWRK
jgi:acetyl-CoA carboxylase biotin carboxylase subunit